MSNQIAHIDLNSAAQLPAYLQAFQSTIGRNLVVGGAGRNRIGLKGNRFRLVVNGQEEGIVEENYLDLIIVGAAPGVSRIFYADAYDSDTKAPPTCYSADGITPADDVKNKQSSKCATCPQNEKGSRITDGGIKAKACSYFKRLAVIMPSDPSRVFQLDCKAMSLFGDSKAAQNKFSLGEYGKKLGTRGIDPGHIVTRVSFDTDESVPKLLFMPTRFLDADEAPLVADAIKSDDVKAILEISSATTDLSEETSLPAPAAAHVAPVVKTPTASVVKTAPAVVKQAAPVVKQAPAPVQTPAAASDDAELAALLAELDAE